MNKGYYDVVIDSSFAKLINKKHFELIYNIQANEKYYFNELKLKLPEDFEKENFVKIKKLFKKLKGEPYSINQVEDILEEIDKITIGTISIYIGQCWRKYNQSRNKLNVYNWGIRTYFCWKN